MNNKFFALEYTGDSLSDNDARFVYADVGSGVALFASVDAAKTYAAKRFRDVQWMTEKGWSFCGNYGTYGSVSVVPFELLS